MREIARRINTEASSSDASYDRRKPRLLSTGVPELASDLSGINAKIPEGEFGKGKVSTGGRWAKDDQHTDTAYQTDIVKKAKDLAWGEGSKYIPDGALKQNYVQTSALKSLKQNVKTHGNAIAALKKKVQQLEQGGKKK